ncbi:MAG: hypothetical protein U0793_33445 [Gemmataceae bacterium]
MNDAELPDDVSRWPKDPFRLLGVSRSVSEKELRKAYALLIRRFKPEHHPEQFRRIREAYDIITRYLPWAAPQPDPPAPTGAPLGNTGPSPAGVEDELGEIDAAIRGEREDEAHRRLRELIQRQGPRPALALRLYWLLELWPHLSPREPAADGLVRALKEQPHDFRCREAYRRLIDARPEEAFSPRFLDWLDALPPGPLLLEAVAWRWQAAAALERVNIPAEDLARLAPICAKDDRLWSRLVFLALDYLMWAPERYLEERCAKWLRELEERHDVHNELQGDFHRLDILRDLKRGLTLLPVEPGRDDFVRLIRLSWVRPVSEYRAELLSFLERLLADPETGLYFLDRVAERAPVVLGQFVNMLEALRVMQRRWAEPPAAAPLLEAAARHLAAAPAASYEAFRLVLMQTCMTEFVEVPHLISSLPFKDLHQNDQYFLAHAYDDGPLIGVVRAYLLFHG